MNHTKIDEKTFHTDSVLLISFAHLIHDVYGSFLAPLLPLLIQKLHFSYALAGFLTVAQRFPSIINPWLGVIADRVALRYFIILSPAVTAIAMSLLGNAPSYFVLVVLLVIMGISSACYHVPSPVMIRQIAGNQVGKGMSFYMFGGELARAVGPLVVVGAVSLWGLEGTYKLIPFGIAASVFLYLRLKDIRLQQSVHTEAHSPGLLKTLHDFLPIFVGLSGMTFFMGGMKAALASFLPSYLTQQGLSLTTAGIALSVLECGGGAGVLVAGYLSDKFGRKFVLLVASLFSPVLMLIFLLSPPIFALPILAFLGFFLFSTSPVMLAVVQESASARPAYINGIYMMINFIISSSLTVVVGGLSDWLGFEKTFFFFTFCFFGTLPFLLLLPGGFRPSLLTAQRSR